MTVLYCTPNDIRENSGGTDEGTGSCARLADDQLTTAIRIASAKVSSYGGQVFEDDGSGSWVLPEIVFAVTVQLATYYATMIYRKGKAIAPTEPVFLGYQDAMATLTAISTGAIAVSPATPTSGPSSTGYGINKIPRVFTGDDSNTRLSYGDTVEPGDPFGDGYGTPLSLLGW